MLHVVGVSEATRQSGMAWEKLCTGNRLILTIGTATRSKEDFISLLKSKNVSAIVDVRRFPTSRFEHFKRAELEKTLKENGIRYVYMGDKLGGYRKGGYQQYTESEDFRQGIAEVEKLATDSRIAIVCAEKFPWRCHRRFIAEHLEKLGWEVIHIIDEERWWRPKDSTGKGGGWRAESGQIAEYEGE